MDKTIFQFDDITFKNLFNGGENYFTDERADFIAKLYNQTMDLYQDGLVRTEWAAIDITQRLSEFEDWIWVVYKGDQPVGMIAVDNWDYQNDYLHACSLHTWCIKEHKCVKAMLKAANFAKNMLFNRGLKRIFTYIDEENTNGVRFYESIGFQKEGLIRARVYLHGELRNEYILASIS